MKYDYRKEATNALIERGVDLEEVAKLVFFLQEKYHKNLQMDVCREMVDKVLGKREVQFTILTGIELDKMAEQGKLSPVVSDLMMRDFGLYGVDEVLALSICNVYGSIGFTNFGYIDKLKPGILKEIDEHGDEPGRCNTYLDDIVGAIAAAAAARLAHQCIDGC
jgi:phosphatidylglycerophosphatase A